MNAARILGASFWHQMRYLVLPMLKPVILIALIIRAIEVFKIFDAVYLLTKGGPGERDDDDLDLLYSRGQRQRAAGATPARSRSSSSSSSASSRFEPSGRSSRRRTRRSRSSIGSETPADAQTERVEEAIEAEARV